MYDLAIIGAGPGGYVAAIRARQLGMKVVCIDKAKGGVGGACLNVGCIPSKALLHASHMYREIGKQQNWGITAENISIDIPTMQKTKQENVKVLIKGVEFLLKKNKVEYMSGKASFKDARTLTVTEGEKFHDITARNFLIATGSTPIPFESMPFDEEKILSSTGCLELKEAPKELLIVGGGYIGVEMGSVWSRLGARVTIIEYTDSIVPNMDKAVRDDLLKLLKKQGINFMLNTKVMGIKKNKTSVTLTIEDRKTQKRQDLKAPKIMISIGRCPVTENMNLEKVGVDLDDKGFIKVDKKCMTSQSHIYAIGDVIGGAMLAYKAEEEGVAVVEGLHSGHFHKINPITLPAVIFTHPEVACVGYTEEQAKKSHTPYNIGIFPFAANSRSKTVGSAEGFVKIIAHKETDEILGVHILGEEAGSLISEAVVAMEFKATAEDIAYTCHAHPTFSEAMKEAALAVHKRAIHT